MERADWQAYQEGQPARTLHVHGSERWHGETFLVGNREALEDLRRALDEALQTGSGLTLAYAADGEGFSCGVLCVEDEASLVEAVLPYHGDLARDKRELEEVLTPTVIHGDEPEVKLARWRRMRPERCVRLESAADVDEPALLALLESAGLELAEATEVVARLQEGARPVVQAKSEAAAGELATEVRALDVAAELLSVSWAQS